MIFSQQGTVIPVWNLNRVDPGYIYLIKHRTLYKIGKTTRTKDRIRSARTWLPDIKVIGIKPFWDVSHHERQLHNGFCRYWYFGEWYKFGNDHYARDLLIRGFKAFSDDLPDQNSINFIYWVNGSGIGDFLIERTNQNLKLRQFQKQESGYQKPLA
ncbi:MAG: GIY-YIG nuclease family protein [Hyphomicrobiales bacterium]